MGFVAVIAWTWFSPSPPPPVQSIAIMPIENLSGDPAKEYIVAGIKNTLAQRLSELPGYTIKNVKGRHDGEATDVSRELGVESMLYGSVQVHNGALKIVYEIVNGSDGAIMKSGEETGAVENLFGVQERLAKAVRDELAGARTPELISRVAPDSEAYNSYLRGSYLLEHRFEERNLEEAIRLFEESIGIDESYGPAYLGLATAYALMPDYREAALDEYLGRAVETVNKGVEMDPRIADLASAIHGFVHYQRKEWTEAEEAYRQAVSAEVVDTNAFSWYSQMLSSVGRLHESREVALQGELIDPDSTVINSRIAMIYTWLGNTGKADEYFERANDLDATGIIHDMAYALFLKRTGQLDRSRTMALAAATTGEYETSWINPVYTALAEPTAENARAALEAINKTWDEGNVIPHIVILVRTLLGDVEGAMAIARLLDNPGETFSMEILYIDELAPLRRHPEFIQLLESLNVVAHWKDVGCRWEDDEVRCD
jgi:TolB-like protein/Tfp pilus assembly protein PilF